MSNTYTLIEGDCLEKLEHIEKKSIDMIFADPPYFLSNDGFTCKGGKAVSVNKGDWDKSMGFENNIMFTEKWIAKCKELLTDNGTIWISGTMHNIYAVGYILQKLHFSIMNDISWYKPNAPPHIACRYFAHAHETLLWAKKTKKAKHTFHYEYMKNWDNTKDMIKNAGKQMRSVWSIPLTPQKEKKEGKHPTQKPEELLRRIILSSTNEGDMVLDPFMGSGTTGKVALECNRNFIGIESHKEYIAIAKKRIENMSQQEKYYTLQFLENEKLIEPDLDTKVTLN